MWSRLKPRSIYDVMAVIGCLAAIGTGTAYAANTVFTHGHRRRRGQDRRPRRRTPSAPTRSTDGAVGLADLARGLRRRHEGPRLIAHLR